MDTSDQGPVKRVPNSQPIEDSMLPSAGTGQIAIEAGKSVARAVFASVHGHAQSIIAPPPQLQPIRIHTKR